jgi:hypothetical protein
MHLDMDWKTMIIRIKIIIIINYILYNCSKAKRVRRTQLLANPKLMFSCEYQHLPEIHRIVSQFNENYEFFRDVYEFTIPQILQKVEETLNFLEKAGPVLQTWIQQVLEENRGAIWLSYGLDSKAPFDDRKRIWPFLYNRENPQYCDFIVDWKGAQDEFARQEARRSTHNPAYTPFHPNGCSQNCCCWMLDCDEWEAEERQEQEVSRNIFFNTALQRDFYKQALKDLESVRSQWFAWMPPVPFQNRQVNPVAMQQTPLQIVRAWIRSDFSTSYIVGMFRFGTTFKRIWTQVGEIDWFVATQREKLRTVPSLF